jgi:predicted CXXCH cytochrome family protein
VENQQELCATCHENVGEQHFHPYGPPARDPRTGEDLQCSSCHNPHSSDYKALLTHDLERDLCLQCHQGANFQVRPRGGRN